MCCVHCDVMVGSVQLKITKLFIIVLDTKCSQLSNLSGLSLDLGNGNQLFLSVG